MPLLVTHTTSADGTFSAAGAAAWNATHAIAGTLDLATETTGTLDLVTRTTGSLDLTARSTGTIDLLTQTRGATANQLMYGGASGQVAQSSGMVWDEANNRLTVNRRIRAESLGASVEISFNGFTRTTSTTPLTLKGFTAAPAVTSVGGDVELIGGNASVNSSGGTILIRGGAAVGSTGSNSGGAIDAIAGSASSTDPTGAGGAVTFQGGDAYGVSAYAGPAAIQGGFASSGGTAGAASLVAGGCIGSTGTPGDIYLIVGGQTTGSVVGTINISSIYADPVAVTAGTGATHAADLPVTVDGVQYYIRLYS